ncbi:MAG: DUF423 domain-containing protein [Chromatiales bacterium]|nr:MAG: DUF423 domain-containing protein [Chromatiales bacterium]
MQTVERVIIVTGCILLTAAGALSAYGFHGLADSISPAKQESWHWAVDMQFYHALGMVLVGLLGGRIGPSWPLRLAGAAMLAGILIFSGLIYAETLGAPESIGEIVPTGGTLFMLSWLLVAIGVWRAPSKASLLS